MRDVLERPHGYAGRSSDEIRDAVESQAPDWKLREVGNDRFIATRSFKDVLVARVALEFDGPSFSIRYLGSHNLNGEDVPRSGRIHKRYNSWVDELAAAVEQGPPK